MKSSFDKKRFAKVKKLIIKCFKNALCIPFINRLMINVRKMLQMNI